MSDYEHEVDRYGGPEHWMQGNPQLAEWWFQKYGNRRGIEHQGQINFTAFDNAVCNAFMEGQQLGNRIKGDLRVTKVRDRVVITAKFEEWSQQTTINAGSPEEAEKMAEAVRNVIKVARGFDPTAAESG